MIVNYDRFILIGTSHVSKESELEISQVINNGEDIEAVAIELDIQRLKNLLSKTNKKQKQSSFSTIKQIGVSGFLFAKIAGYMQKKVGDNLGIEPGLDMKTAYISARDKKLPTALIDIPIHKTLKKLSSIPFTKKISMFFKLFTSGFKKKNRVKMQFDVKKGVPSQKKIDEMLGIVKNEVPLFYDILIEQRNRYMVKKLLELKENHEGKIVAVVGAGHITGMLNLLKEKSNSSNSSFSFSFETQI